MSAAAVPVTRLFSGPTLRLFRNMGWIGLSEIMGRASRLVTAVALARIFSPEDFGIVASALTMHELIRVFGSMGLGVMIIQARPDELTEVCTVANRLNWLAATALFVMQSLLAFPISLIAGEPRLALMIAALAVVHLIFPWSMVAVFLVQRENRMKVTGLIGGLTLLTENLLTAALALGGFGIWSVVWPRFVSTITWVVLHRRARPWRPSPDCGWHGWRRVLAHGGQVLGTEVLKTLRVTLDKPLIGALFGMDVLGMYYFAFSAGLGISQSLLSALSTVLLPHLRDGRDNGGQFHAHAKATLRSVGLIVPPLILTQALLCPLYVPLIFGEAWTPAVPVVLVLCLSAIPRPFADVCSQIQRALGRPGADLVWNAVLTASLAIAMVLGARWGLIGAAWAVLAIHLIASPLFVVWTFKHAALRHR
ncbi:hypothetical protein Sp245p_25190 (plasmid) [Azospirillum baldaniorum]|uniref:Polysaccharide biosynthesis protein n=1 Tax=Azospirillum baldaniorum TaxID=1064539 RepID=A0A9P1JYK5_9PROT|nr:oligosaccharide flippase family protein [Azospirillum baldaniorum]AWJ93127.1 hypothetical protein Sp245p_25190 [Azospirillum baldaniorum]TWA52904.1 O-antigen/teichoic acid export membrane protein [Azospirillum baldaniorum]TWA76104.1 O-antigen/teichoic acid export membrane protein [Azospirillum brasilense]CCD02266.1 conserved membrane protein of unknown function [Azospirillum baldaniorum]